MSADLFAAFEDFSQPPKQKQSQHPTVQSASTPFSVGQPPNTLVPTAIQKQWGQSSTVSNPYQHSSQTSTPEPAPYMRPTSVATSPLANIPQLKNEDTEDDDGWGDFEVAADTAPSPKPVLQAASISARAPPITEQPITTQKTDAERRRVVRASTLDLITNSLVDYQTPHTSSQSTLATLPTQHAQPHILSATFQPSSKPPEPKAFKNTLHDDPNVLFDADDFELGEQDGEENWGEDDDDFGEFETVSPPTSHPVSNLISSTTPMPVSNETKSASELLLDLVINDPTPLHAKPAQTSSILTDATIQGQELNHPKSHSVMRHSRNSESHAKSPSLEDDWASFDDSPNQPARPPPKTVESSWDWDSVEEPKTMKPKSPIEKTLTPPIKHVTSNDDTSWEWDPVEIKTENEAEIEASALPPINIPPPSILMSLFPQLFEQANEYLYKPVSGQSQNIKDRILSDPKVYEFLRGYLSLATVVARIISGRRMRWHRDKFLSQNMSISAAGSKGMKLAGVDKSQTTRDDREAADVVSHWKTQIGRLRSTVASANLTTKSGGKPLKIPEITDAIQIQTAKDVPTAPKACIICGLKRNERLAKVDHEVEDSFGEWWVDHWGHVTCKRFWLQHENMLRQR